MSNQINEGAARYQAEIAGQNPPERSAALRPQSPQQLVTDHLDLWTSTVTPKSTSGRGRGSGKSSKIELTGIKKLRELILELAVRGKLVAQNPDDEPASKLLERIEAEKAQLIKDGTLKKQKPLAPISEDEKPFELPEGWMWVRFGALGQVKGGKRVPKGHSLTSENTGNVYIRVTDMKNYSVKLDDLRYISDEVKNEISQYTINSSDVYITIAGTIGAVGTIPDELNGMNLTENAAKFTSVIVNKNWVVKSLCSTTIQEYFESCTNQQAQPKLALNKIEGAPLALPPLAEQQRIVAKVDELMALCDQLEQQSEHQLTAHQQLTDTLLATLTESANAQELNDNWQRLAQHFDLLLAGPMGAWAIDRLKDTILQLAVMGKLVPQNPDDEPASELLERIEEEKTRLVKEGKIKKPKKLPPVSEEEKPFELPEGWEWVKFASVVSFESELVRPEDFQDYDQVAPDSIEKGTGNLLFRRTVKESGVKGPNNRFYSGQILYSKIRPSLSKAIIAEFDGLCSADMYPLRPHTINTEYLLRAILSEPFLIQVRKEENRIKMPKLNIPTLSNFCIPLPPLTEQHRIVAKVDELFGLCDQLKDCLKHASETEQHLTNAIVEQALS